MRLGQATPLTSDDFAAGRALAVPGAPRARYAWDTGEAVGRYLAELKRGRLVGRVCRRCRRTLIPPRMFCELCHRPTDAWAVLKDTGVVNTFSVCRVAWDVKRLERPELPAVIEIDGASPGMGILHLLGEVDPKRVRIGMKVKAVWKRESARTGSITDILYFKPVA
jgi:uncharacterized OB-fold protein